MVLIQFHDLHDERLQEDEESEYTLHTVYALYNVHVHVHVYIQPYCCVFGICDQTDTLRPCVWTSVQGEKVASHNCTDV